MSAIYPATEQNIRGFAPDGRAVVNTKNHEVPVIFYEGKDGEKTQSTIGASPADDMASAIAYRNPREMWTPKERKSYRNFMQLWRRWQGETIPVEKEALRWKLMNKYGTIHPDQYMHNLNVQMIKDPRLLIKTRRGTVKTSVRSQHERKARSLEGGAK